MAGSFFLCKSHYDLTSTTRSSAEGMQGCGNDAQATTVF